MSWGPPWKLSDDTQLTLATCVALIATAGPDPVAIAAAFVRWHSDQRLTGLGSATLGAIKALAAGGHWALVGRRGEMAAGNGAAMRIAPVALWTDPRSDQGRLAVRDISRITHHSDEAYAGALAVALAIRLAFTGAWAGNPSLLTQVVAMLPDTAVRDRLLEVAAASARPIAHVAARFGCSGHVVESVPLALFAAQQVATLGVESMLEEVVRAGGDTDTNASIAGQVAGCLLGMAGLPSAYVDELPEIDLLRQTADRFAGSLPSD